MSNPQQLERALGKTKGLDYRNVIAFVIPFAYSNGGIINTIKGASRIASERGYFLDIKYSNNDLDEERELLENLYGKGVGGLFSILFQTERIWKS